MKCDLVFIIYDGCKIGLEPVDFSSANIRKCVERIKDADFIERIILLTDDAGRAEKIECEKLTIAENKDSVSVVWVARNYNLLKSEGLIFFIGSNPLINHKFLKRMVEYYEENKPDILVNESVNILITERGKWGKWQEKLVRKENGGYVLSEKWKEYPMSIYGKGSDSVISSIPAILKEGNVKHEIFKTEDKFEQLTTKYAVTRNLYRNYVFNRIEEKLKGNPGAAGIEEIRRHYEEFAGSDGEFLNINLEFTNDCNLKCVYCPRGRMKRRIGYIDVGTVDAVCSQWTGSTNVSGFGEPVMHPDFEKLMKKLSSISGHYCFWTVNTADKGVYLFTNATLLDENLSKTLIDATGVLFNFDATEPVEYERIKGVDMYGLSKENILRFLKLKKEKRRENTQLNGLVLPIAGMNRVSVKDTEATKETFMSAWDKGFKGEILFSNDNTLMERDRFYESAELPLEFVVLQKYNDYCRVMESMEPVDYTPLNRFPCRQLLTSMTIFWNGDVPVCGQDFDGNYIVGNVNERPLMDIWFDDALAGLRNDHLRGKYGSHPLCAKCRDWYVSTM